jgi:hypothetical protein
VKLRNERSAGGGQGYEWVRIQLADRCFSSRDRVRVVSPVITTRIHRCTCWQQTTLLVENLVYALVPLDNCDRVFWTMLWGAQHTMRPCGAKGKAPRKYGSHTIGINPKRIRVPDHGRCQIRLDDKVPRLPVRKRHGCEHECPQHEAHADGLPSACSAAPPRNGGCRRRPGPRTARCSRRALVAARPRPGEGDPRIDPIQVVAMHRCCL